MNNFSAQTFARLGELGLTAVAICYLHFYTVVISQHWRSGGCDVSNAARGGLLKQTTALKQKPWMKPVKLLYALTEKTLGTLGLADNLVIVFRKG